jgi:hypothetical protein
MTKFELWSYTIEDNESLLWRRQSTSLLDATWHPDAGYIFFSDTESISAIEQDARGVRQRWELANTGGATRLISKKQHLFFTVGDQVFDLPLYD